MPLQQRTLILGIFVGLSLTLLPFNPTIAQTSPSLPKLELPQFINPSTKTDTQVATETVKLDEHRLFTIAESSVPDNAKPNNTSPVKIRLQGIESNLDRLVNANLNPETLKVNAAIDTKSNLPVISVNGKYFMTVTTLDAQLQGEDPATYAKTLTQTIQQALIRAKQERQPKFLMRQIVVAGVILLVMNLSSLGLRSFQRRLKTQQERIQAEMPLDPVVAPKKAVSLIFSTRLTLQRLFAKRQQKTFKELQRHLLQLLQIGIWSGSGIIILGLFPYTRWLQPIFLSVPIQIVAVIAIAYAHIRLGDVLIDRLFAVFEAEKSTSVEVSQRLLLRVSTFSRVAKGLVTIIALSFAVLALLAIIGIDLVPLLAGAGIAGLGITLACQSLIKDIINGMLILLEDQYAVGDVIQIGVVRGLVEHMNLRMTQLRNTEGRLITIPNSAISIVENLSKNWSQVDLAIPLSHTANLDQAIQLIEKTGQEMSHDHDWRYQILQAPEVLGVDEFTSTGVTIRVWIKTQPSQQWKVGREFRFRLKMALDAQGIAMGVP